MQQPDLASTSDVMRSLKKLRAAVWVLALLVILNIGLTLFVSSLTRSFILGRPFTISESSLPPHLLEEDPLNGFYGWPLEKQIEASSIILLTKFSKEDGKMKPVITEILRRKPATVFHYKVGDVYEEGSAIRELPDVRTTYGEGQIIFLTGSPALMRVSSTYDNNRLRTYGGLPLDELRALIQKSK